MKKCAPVKKISDRNQNDNSDRLFIQWFIFRWLWIEFQKLFTTEDLSNNNVSSLEPKKIFKFDISKLKHENWNEVGQDHDLVLQHIYCCSNSSKYKYWLNKSRTRRRKIVYEKKVRMVKLKEEHLKNTWFYRLHFMHSVKKLSLDVLLGVAFHRWIYGAHADCLYGII